jgi:hypothetical protein
VHWCNAYGQYASELEAKGSVVDARQVRLHVQDLERHIKEMDLLQQSMLDGTLKPVFLQLPSAPSL